MTKTNPPKFERIDILKRKMLEEPRYVSIEQAKIITEVYQNNPDQTRAKKRALSLKAALERMEISVEKEELIVANRTKGVRSGVVFPESGCAWVMQEFETLESRPQDKFKVHFEDIDYFKKHIYPFWHDKSLEHEILNNYGDKIGAIAKVVKINQKDHAQGHICPDVATWLKLGPKGLLQLAQGHLEKADESQKEFYECTIITLEGALEFIGRYHDLISKMTRQEHPYRDSLTQVGQICRNLTQRAPETFHEAVQALWFLFVILHMESNASSFSPGRVDQYLYPYYRNDIEKGILSENEALEIIEALYLKFNQIVYLRNEHSAKYFAGFPIGFNVAIGGLNQDGEDDANDLSFLLLQAQKDIGLPQPNLSVRLNRQSSSKLIQKSIEVVAQGSGMPQFFNDEAIIEPLITNLEIEPGDAYNYAIVGCVELTTQGNNLGWSDAAMFNFNKVLELTLNNGRCLITGAKLGLDLGNLEDFKTYQDFEAAYQKQLDYFIEKMIDIENKVEKAHQDCLPSAFLSTVVADCLDQGIDVTRGGAKYNLSGIQMIQIASLADSLSALKDQIFDKEMITRHQLLKALKADYQGHEIIQTQLLKRTPKFGNDVQWVDEMGAKWAEYFNTRLKDFTNYRGGKYHTGMYTVSAHVPMGENVGASPDGRNALEPLADGGMSPVYGRDRSGPTAVLKSVARMNNSLTTNGGLLNMKFLPDFFTSTKGKEKFESFLRAFVDLEVPHIQFNVVNRDDLLDAQENPQNHQSLTIRVAGYTAYFVELDNKLQNEIIARNAYDSI